GARRRLTRVARRLSGLLRRDRLGLGLLVLAVEVFLHDLLLARHLLVQLAHDRGIDRAYGAADLDAQRADHLDHRVARHLEILRDLVDAQLFPGSAHSMPSSRSRGAGVSSTPSARGASRTRSSSSPVTGPRSSSSAVSGTRSSSSAVTGTRSSSSGRSASSISTTSEGSSSYTCPPATAVSSAVPAAMASSFSISGVNSTSAGGLG